MVMKDLDIHSEKDLENAVERIANRVEKDLDSCPYYRRTRLAGERMLRYAMKSLKIRNLPNS